jgi:hypothetical protein
MLSSTCEKLETNNVHQYEKITPVAGKMNLQPGINYKAKIKLLNKSYEKLYFSIDKELFEALSVYKTTVKHKYDEIFGDSYTMSCYLNDKLSKSCNILRKEDLTKLCTYDSLITLRGWKFGDQSGYKIVVFPKEEIAVNEEEEEKDQIYELKRLLE